MEKAKKTKKSNVKKNITKTSSNVKVAVKSKDFVTKDSTIGDIITNYPESAEVMMKYGLHCFGCHVAYYETLEQGVAGHGMDPKIVPKLVKDMNEFIAKSKIEKPKNNDSIAVTLEAVKKILELQKKEKKDGYGLRFAIIANGCSMMYAMNFEKDPNKDDFVIKQGKLNVFIDRESMQLVNGSTIDFVMSSQGTGFKITNPNAKGGCGCSGH